MDYCSGGIGNGVVGSRGVVGVETLERGGRGGGEVGRGGGLGTISLFLLELVWVF